MAISPDGQYLAASESMGMIDLWNVGGEFKTVLKGHELLGWNVTLAFSYDGRYLASGGMDQQVILWDMKSGSKILSIQNLNDSFPVWLFCQMDNG